ncbi:MAG: hypothetical protein QM653_02820 [Dysgonomonas sp.]|uniref:hypothetical protein n=1 Tax=Dysgonomonas sp. TaxID=1891233 RepID=UPI0039E34680
MYELKDDVVCIPATALYDDLKLISYDIYRNVEFRKKLGFIQRGGNGRKALIAFNSLPPDIRQNLVDKIGEPTEEHTISRVEFFFREEVATRHFYENYKLPDGRNLTPEAQDEYTINATMLLAVEAVVNETQMTRLARGGTKKVNWDGIIKTMNALKYKKVDDKYPYRHSLPSSDKRLREALKKLKEQGYESLIPLGKYNNKNRAKVKTDEQHYLIQEMLSNGRNLDNKTISDMYNAAASRLGWETLTPAAIGVWRKKLKRITEPGRRGASHYNNTLAMQNKRSRPSAPLFMWSADGWTAELLYQETKLNKKGHRVTTYLNRLTVEIIMDAYNNYPVGYAIGDSENAEMIEKAMRNAVNHTKELFGERYRCWQIQSDNFQKKRLAPMWKALGDKWTPAQVGNAKAKPIEQWFKHEMQKQCQISSDYNNWAGYGITANKDKQVNDEWLDANKRGFPTKEQCVKQIERIIERIRAKYREEFVSAFNALPEADKLPLTEELYLYKFGHKTEPNKLEGQGLTPRICGVEHWFDCFDLMFRNYSHERWIVHYDPDDTSRALAVAKDREDLRFIVEEKYVQPMALRDRTEGDALQIKRVNDYNQADREYVTEERAKGIEVVQNLLMQNKELNGGLAAKLLITDSQGQHKKHLYSSATEVEYECIGTQNHEEQEYLRSKTDLSKYLNN